MLAEGKRVLIDDPHRLASTGLAVVIGRRMYPPQTVTHFCHRAQLRLAHASGLSVTNCPCPP